MSDPSPHQAELVLLVHSGSHGYGESIFRAHAAEYDTECMDPESAAGEAYLTPYDLALRWARWLPMPTPWSSPARGGH